MQRKWVGLAVLGSLIQTQPLRGDDAAVKFPTHTIGNDRFALDIFLPDAEHGFYRGLRFDRSSMIQAVRFGDHRVFQPWRETSRPTAHDGNASGPAEEFDIKQPQSYATAAPGESFMKIGVGHLKRADDKPYRFTGRYAVLDPGRWTVETTDESVTATHTLEPRRGFGYTLTRTFRLADDGAGFVMRRTLSNTGTQPIETEVYTHNFVIINGDVPIGPDYLMQTRFPLRDADLKLRGNAEAGEHDIRITRPIERGSAWAGFAGTDDAALNELTVSHSASGVRLTIAGDRPLARFAVWTDGRALCPEPFVTIKLAPGESQTWSTTYSFDAVEP